MSMLNTKISNASDLNKRLTGIKTSAKNIRNGLQEAIAFGLIKYRDGTGDSGELARVYTATLEMKGVNSKLVKEYITDHTNLVSSKDKKGNPKFKKAAKGEPIEVTEPTVEWFNYKKDTGDKDKTVHVKRRIDSLTQAINKAVDNGETVDMEGAAEALAQLQATIAAHEGVAKAQAEDVEPAH